MQYCLKACLYMALLLLLPLSGPLAESPGPASEPITPSTPAETETDQSAAIVKAGVPTPLERKIFFSSMPIFRRPLQNQWDLPQHRVQPDLTTRR